MRTIAVVLSLLTGVAAPLSGQDVAGRWVLAVDLGAAGAGDATFVLQQDTTAITGTYSGTFGTDVPVTGTVQDGGITFTFNAEQVGQVSYEGTLEGDTMSGTVTYGNVASGTFEGSRAPDADAPPG